VVIFFGELFALGEIGNDRGHLGGKYWPNEAQRNHQDNQDFHVFNGKIQGSSRTWLSGFFIATEYRRVLDLTFYRNRHVSSLQRSQGEKSAQTVKLNRPKKPLFKGGQRSHPQDFFLSAVFFAAFFATFLAAFLAAGGVPPSETESVTILAARGSRGGKSKEIL